MRRQRANRTAALNHVKRGLFGKPNNKRRRSIKRWTPVFCFLVGIALLYGFFSAYRRELTYVYETEIKESIDIVSESLGFTEIFRFADVNPEEITSQEFAEYFVNYAKSKSVTSKSMKCQPLATTWGTEQICCSFKEKEKPKISCLPSLVVIGVQKGGTTALHSYLMLHPNLYASKRKELHIYDMDRSWSGKMQFKVANNFHLHSQDFYSKQVTFETTPSYTASPDACARMSVSLPGDTKFVLIIRNPIERAWSELQMKARRVDKQVDFKLKFYQCRGVIRHCFTSSLATLVGSVGTPRNVAGCLKKTKGECASLTRHSKFPLLFRSIKMPKVSKKGIGSKFYSACFDKSYPDFPEFEKGCFDDLKIFKEKNIPLPGGLRKEIALTNDRCLNHMDLVNALQAPKFLNLTKDFSRNQIKCWFEHMKQVCVHCRNVTNVDDCYRTCVDSPVHAKSIANCKRTDYKASTEPFCKGVYCACFPNSRMPSDISKGYFFRGLYNIQLRNCFQFLNRERILVIYNSELRTKNRETMKKIVDFVGLPDFDYGRVTYADADAAFDEFYPKFEEQTGWSANGTSSLGKTIPSSVHDLLLKAYSEDVKGLRALLGNTIEFQKEFREFA